MGKIYDVSVSVRLGEELKVRSYILDCINAEIASKIACYLAFYDTTGCISLPVNVVDYKYFESVSVSEMSEAEMRVQSGLDYYWDLSAGHPVRMFKEAGEENALFEQCLLAATCEYDKYEVYVARKENPGRVITFRFGKELDAYKCYCRWSNSVTHTVLKNFE